MKILKFNFFVIMFLVVFLIIVSGFSRSEDPMIREVRVLASSDDAEERYRSNSDYEFRY